MKDILRMSHKPRTNRQTDRQTDRPQTESETKEGGRERDRYNDKFYGDAKSPEKEVSRGFHRVRRAVSLPPLLLLCVWTDFL